jgi:hypothetical protein
MNEPIDIVHGINSLDDVLHPAGYMMQTTSLDDVRRCPHPKARIIEADLITHLKLMNTAVAKLLDAPDDIPARTQFAAAANRLPELDEDFTILSAEIEA